ncbi:MAG: efflux RND transporter periplasmic adaptor subunit [Chloroflexi bacterium]|nr:efflux RND transporter periplasmic adaptor subunit [Chloroflexota bacterium]
MGTPKRIAATVLLLASLVLILAGCGSQDPDPLGAFYSTATVTRETIADVVQMAGQVVALHSSQLTMGTVGGRVREIPVRLGQEVPAGEPLLHLDTAELERKLREAEADLSVATAALARAQRESGQTELQRAEANLAYAEYEMSAAKLRLTLAEKAGLQALQQAVADAEVALQLVRDQLRLREIGAGQSTIRTLEYDVAFYQRTLRDLPANDPSRARVEKALADTERALAQARTGREGALRAGQEEVDKKQEDLDRARASLKRATSGEEDPANLARLAYQQALASFESAQRKVEELRAGGESDDLRAARTAYEAALADVEGAKAALSAATLRAPFAGLVLAIYVQEGQTVQASDNLLFLADLKTLRVLAQVSEMDVPKLAVGQKVRITFGAYPGTLFSGEVLSLPLRGQGRGGLTFYQVETSLVAEDTSVRLGLMANVRAVIGERKDVLAVPVAALIYRSPEEIVVKVRSADGKTSEQPVEVGINDGILAEVLSGLEEGQTVLVPLVPSQEPFQPGPYGPYYYGALPRQEGRTSHG